MKNKEIGNANVILKKKNIFAVGENIIKYVDFRIYHCKYEEVKCSDLFLIVSRVTEKKVRR